jgi:hypothetical protein
LGERDHFEDLSLDGRIILNYLQEVGEGAWTVFMWLRIGTCGVLL